MNFSQKNTPCRLAINRQNPRKPRSHLFHRGEKLGILIPINWDLHFLLVNNPYIYNYIYIFIEDISCIIHSKIRVINIWCITLNTCIYIYIHNSIYKGAGERPSTQVQNQVLALLQFGASDPWAWLAAGPSRGDLFGTQNRELWWTKKIYVIIYCYI